MLEQAEAIDYPNSKSAIPYGEQNYSLVCHNVWADAQQLEEGRRGL